MQEALLFFDARDIPGLITACSNSRASNSLQALPLLAAAPSYVNSMPGWPLRNYPSAPCGNVKTFRNAASTTCCLDRKLQSMLNYIDYHDIFVHCNVLKEDKQ